MRMDEIKVVTTESLALPERRPAWALQPHRVLGGTATGQPSIALCEDALLAVHRHAAGSNVEIGGLLLGDACAWEGETHVAVLATLAAESTQAGPAHLTFTVDSWAGLLARKQRQHPAKAILGWYHSHPRMGIFLSEMDLAIQHGFFREPWHVALVVNGHDRIGGLFAWQAGEVQPARRLIWLPRQGWRHRIELAAEQGWLSYQLVPRRRGRAAVPARGRRLLRWDPWRR